MAEVRQYDDAELAGRLADELPDWAFENGHLVRRFEGNGWRASMLLANGIAHLAEAAWHHPDMLVTWGGVEVRLRTHDVDAITDKDFELAAVIERYVNWSPEDGSALDGAPTDGAWRYRT
jgi:4a-hydroxytetrahydrobiopterin dehydratase